MPRRILPLVLIATLALASAAPSRAQLFAPPSPLPPGTQAPNFRARTLTGQTLTLASLRGHVVLIDFWATWCGPCRMAIPTLETLYRQYLGRGLRVVGMSMDDPSTVQQVPTFARRMHITYPLTVGMKQNAPASQEYNVTGIPAQLLIDKRGVIRWSQDGYSPDEGVTLSALIKQLLAEKA